MKSNNLKKTFTGRWAIKIQSNESTLLWHSLSKSYAWIRFEHFFAVLKAVESTNAAAAFPFPFLPNLLWK